MEHTRRWLIGALLTLLAAEVASDDDIKFDPEKADAIFEIPVHIEGDFPAPHIHLKTTCGGCGAVNDFLVFGQNNKTYVAVFFDAAGTRKMQRKLGIDQRCLDECRMGIRQKPWPDAQDPYRFNR